MKQRKNKLFIVCAILLSFLAMELAARGLFIAFDKPRSGHDQSANIFTYAPYVGVLHKPFTEVRPKLNTDRHGFIHNGNPDRNLFVKDTNQFRIFIMGGSTVAGTYVASKKTTLAALLETRLTEKFREQGIKLIPQVINAGVSSYISSQEFALLKWYVIPLDPDYVIILDGSNDSVNYNPLKDGTNEFLRHDIHAYHQKIFQDRNQMFSFSGLLGQGIRLADNYSALMDILHEVAARFRKTGSTLGIAEKASQDEISSTIKINLKQYGRNINASVALCKQFGIGLGYFLQPTLFGNLPNLTEKELGILNGKPNIWHNRNYFTYKKDFYNGAALIFNGLKEQFGNGDITVEDFSRIFTSENKKPGIDFYGDRAHYTDAGREVIVDEILKSLEGNIIKKVHEAQVSKSKKQG